MLVGVGACPQGCARGYVVAGPLVRGGGCCLCPSEREVVTMAKMARCAGCQGVIRKAEIQYRMVWSCGCLSKVTVHDACGSESWFFPVTVELEKLADLMSQQAEAGEKDRERRRADEKARADETAMYICRLELETDRHPAHSCGAPQCPVIPFLSWVSASAYEAYRQRTGGHYQCNMCGRPAREEHNRPECHSCSDWSGCGGGCTLSRVFCETCGISQGS